MATRVFMGVFAAIGACFTLLFTMWGVALTATNGWGTPAAVILGAALFAAVVTVVVVGGVWLFTRSR